MNQSEHRRFTYSKTLIVGFGFLGISIIWPIFNQFIPLFLQAGNPQFESQLLAEGRAIPDVVGFGLAPSLALFIMTWDNLINIFIQPWVGARSDRTWTRFGRRKPWILIGLPIAVVGFVLLPFAPTALALAAFILITNFGMALFRSPTVAWLGDLFLPDDRSKANGVINLMGGIGSLLAFLGGGYLFNNFGRAAPFIAGAILMIVALAVAVWRVREPRQLVADTTAAPPRSVRENLRLLAGRADRSGLYVLLGILFWFIGFNALEAALSSFAVFSLGIAPGSAAIYSASISLSFILFALPAGMLGTKFGRRGVILAGLTGLAIVLGAAFFVIQGVATFIIVLVLGGLFWALVNVNSLPLVYDFGDEGQIGAFTGLYYFSSQLAAVIGPTLGGIVVDVMGDQYRWMFPFSAVFMVLALLVILRIRAAKQDVAQA
ncbi:putative Major facilitator superfamily MFS_1 [Candidatus Promineifilum breve]|uniref:Major facilitator superfamily MFS_1 n=1 Tax=Candidatus Promineifilum breve TaxID=1806508 RepID=A0A170PIY1_9CHLR|nr:MFS transporter [Candidatus Promineifilum breve]CUS05117.2 putative Major facilitator superfamily MFS_1 [Candidatus Promineifilum breve]